MQTRSIDTSAAVAHIVDERPKLIVGHEGLVRRAEILYRGQQLCMLVRRSI